MMISKITARLARLGWTSALLGVIALGACDGDNLFEQEVQGSPRIASVSVLRSSVVGGEAVDITVSATGPRPISAVTVLLRGEGVDATQVLTINPALSSVTRITNVQLPPAASGSVQIYAFAQDVLGQVSPITTGPTVTVTPKT